MSENGDGETDQTVLTNAAERLVIGLAIANAKNGSFMLPCE